jgi:putative membrane protein
MVRFVAWWLSIGVALWVAQWLLPGVHVDSIAGLAVAALVLGMVNAIVRPVMVLLTLPVTILTLGLFYLVVNGIAFSLAAFLVPSFSVDSLGSAILGALVTGLVSWFVGSFFRPGPAHGDD